MTIKINNQISYHLGNKIIHWKYYVVYTHLMSYHLYSPYIITIRATTRFVFDIVTRLILFVTSPNVHNLTLTVTFHKNVAFDERVCETNLYPVLLRNVEQLVRSHLSLLTTAIESDKTAHWLHCFSHQVCKNHTLKSAVLAHQFHTSLAIPFS